MTTPVISVNCLHVDKEQIDELRWMTLVTVQYIALQTDTVQ